MCDCSPEIHTSLSLIFPNSLFFFPSKMAALNGSRNGDVTPPVMEKVNTNIVTLTRFLTEEQIKHKEATGDFT